MYVTVTDPSGNEAVPVETLSSSPGVDASPPVIESVSLYVSMIFS